MPRALDRVQAVVIGASAGGIDVLSTLLPKLPGHFRPAVIIVVHLPRTQPNLLPSIFGAKCKLPVEEAEDKEPVRGGAIYFAPPDYHLLIEAGPAFALSSDEQVNFSRPSIDVLFESAADAYRDRLMGVILSGANNDGAAGISAVRREGGFTVVQSPETAESTSMPLSALKTGPADYVLTIDQIADLLSTLEKPHAS